jgi:hypothetical protein
MDNQTTRQLDRLLADGGVSGPEADAILDRVLATVARSEPRRSRRPVYWAAAGVAAIAAGALLMIVPAAPPAGGFVARGITSSAPTLRVSCSAGELGSCPLTATLVFALAGDQAAGFLSAYAEPIEGGERIWYFSRESESPSLSDAKDGTRVFGRGVKLSGTHRPGHYRVRALVSTRPLSQHEILAGPPENVLRSRTELDLSVTE